MVSVAGHIPVEGRRMTTARLLAVHYGMIRRLLLLVVYCLSRIAKHLEISEKLQLMFKKRLWVIMREMY
jgi:hypothetical protein